jgi:hypothetical protein
MSITYCECVFVALIIQHAMRVSHIVICDLARSTIFFRFISYAAQIKKKKLLNTKRVFFIFSTTFV